MPVAVVADSHLGGPGGAVQPLVEQLEKLPERGCEHLVLLGDIFQIWVGDPRFETPDIRRMVETLAGLRGRGVRVDYVEGNRDFFLAGGCYAHAFDYVGKETAFQSGGRRYLAVHGDGLNARDWRYRFWRRLSKSWVARNSLGLTPYRLARSLVQSTESGLAKTNFKHKVRLPEEAIRSYGERRLSEAYDVLLLGHFHEARTWSVQGGEIRLLEAWFDSRRVEWFGRERG